MTTPTTRCTWFHAGLVHHAFVQPYLPDRTDRCDLLVACRGYIHGESRELRHYQDVVTCLECLNTDWEAVASRMVEEGILTKVDDLKSHSVLHQLLIENGAFAPGALRSNRR